VCNLSMNLCEYGANATSGRSIHTLHTMRLINLAALAVLALAPAASTQSVGVEIRTVPSETPIDQILIGPEAPERPVTMAERSLIGAWGGDGHTLIVSRMPMQDLPTALYLEVSREQAPHYPIWQQVWILRSVDGEVRARAFTFSDADYVAEFYQGAWAAPGRWTPVPGESLTPLGDLRVTETDDGFLFDAPEPLPTTRYGAWNLRMEVRVTADSLTWLARGESAAGQAVWGAEPLSLERLEEPPYPVTIRDDGLVFVDYRVGEGPVSRRGDQAHLNYHGYAANGRRIDAAGEKNRPYTMRIPGPMPPEVNEALIGIRQGGVRRVLIPPRIGSTTGSSNPPGPEMAVAYQVRVYALQGSTP